MTFIYQVPDDDYSALGTATAHARPLFRAALSFLDEAQSYRRARDLRGMESAILNWVDDARVLVILAEDEVIKMEAILERIEELNPSTFKGAAARA